MKRVLLLAVTIVLLFLFSATPVLAGGVAHDRAKAVALNWLRNSMSDATLGIGSEYKIIGEEPILRNEKTVGYNFILSPVGHIIVPARDELPVVKLYSFTTTLSMADNSDVAQWIAEELSLLDRAIETHAPELATVDHSKTLNGRLWEAFDKAEVDFSTTQEPLQTKSAVSLGPLLSTTWDQGTPYNLYTPRWYDSQPTLTGCVATAAAQIMKYWNYPSTGQGSTSYAWYNGAASIVLSTDFSQSNYRWSDMTNTYGSSSTAVQRDAVAKLMADVGIAFHMTFGPAALGGSAAATMDGATIFPGYFRYKNTARTVYRSNYASDSAWMQVFKSELESGRVSQLRIRDPQAGGHSVVVDGYRNSPSEQVHLNVGWSGSYDGWYVTNNINTGSYSWSDVNYQGAVIGIEPPSVTTVPAITTKPATAVSLTGATVNGSVTPNGVAVSSFFEYGATASYGSTTAQVQAGSGTTAVSMAAPLTGLSCGTSYHFRAVASTAGGTRYNGSDLTFTTSACAIGAAPTVITGQATAIGGSEATLNGSANANGVLATGYFQYGRTTGYGSSTPIQDLGSGTGSVTFTATVSGLVCGNVLYHVRAVATNSGGTGYGEDVSFVTGPCPDIDPNPFSFTSQTELALHVTATSNSITISGINTAAPVSISSGGSYSINGAAFTTTAGAVNNGDIVRVRLTTPSSYSTTATATLTIGAVSGTFSVTTVSTGGRVNILVNPGFEAGAQEWVSSSNMGYPIISYASHSGNNASDWFAYLGGDDSLIENIYQDVTIPSSATAASFSFYYSISTEETTAFTQFDTLKAELVDPVSGSTVALLKTLSNLNATTDWTPSQPVDLMAYKGRTLRLKFTATTDFSAQTSFLVDDVAVMVAGPIADTTPPTVVSTAPANAAQGVKLDSAIKATFSKDMDALTLNTTTFTLSPTVTGTVSYDAGGRTATFTPATSLSPGTVYTATISTGATDAAGNALLAPKSWSFTTVSAASGSNLVSNGDFELGRVAWVETNSLNNANINQNTGLGHNDSDWYIYTGSVNSLVAATYQDIAIPAAATAPKLTFWYKITTDETSANTAWDKMAVQIQDPASGATLRTLNTLSNLDQTTGWTQSPQFDLQDFKGRTIRLIFYVTTDASLSTQFRVDDVSITTGNNSLPSGDLNADGVVDVADALLALQIAIGNRAATADFLSRGDVAPVVSGAPQPDGTINVGDALVILEKSVNLVNW